MAQYKRKASASQINLYVSCPRKYYLKYIKGLKEPQSIALIKGSFIHSVIEEFYKLQPKGCGITLENYQTQFVNYADKVFNKVLKQERRVFGKPAPSYEKEFKSLCADDFEYAFEISDAKDIINNYMSLFVMQFKQYARGSKYFNQAWYSARLKFSELELSTDDFIGYVDAVIERDGETILIDWKTSSMYGNIGYSEEYERQVKLYAAMYYKLHGIIPKYCAVVFLRYGVQCYYKIDEATIVLECDELLSWFKNKTKSENIDDYPCKHDGLFCTSNCSKHPDGFKKGKNRCFYDRYCNMELEGKEIVFT